MRHTFVLSLFLTLLLPHVLTFPRGNTALADAPTHGISPRAPSLSEDATRPLTETRDQIWEQAWESAAPAPAREILWSSSGPQGLTWKPYDVTGQPSDRNGRNVMWLKTVLPQGRWQEPSLYVNGGDQVFEMYVDGQLVHTGGGFHADGTVKFVGWPWHIVPLASDDLGKTAYFRIHSQHSHIGLVTPVNVGSRTAHMKR